MSETIGIKKIFDMCILEFCTVITSDMLQRYFILGLSSLGKSFEDIDNFALIIEKEYPSIEREIINNNETILVTSQARIILRTEEIHVKQFKSSSSVHDCLCCMMFLGNLSSFTGTA